MSDVPPPEPDIARMGIPATLRDGSRVRIRQWRSSDTDLLLRGFERLSPDSRYRRFLTPMPRLSGTALRYLTDIDHVDREAMVAVDEQTGDGVGLARYTRDPRRAAIAEVAVTVVDDWQGRGLGTMLLEALCVRAGEAGITRLSALMLATNRTMMDLLGELGPVRIVDSGSGAVEVEVPNPVVTDTGALRLLIKIAAEHDAGAPPRAQHAA